MDINNIFDPTGTSNLSAGAQFQILATTTSSTTEGVTPADAGYALNTSDLSHPNSEDLSKTSRLYLALVSDIDGYSGPNRFVSSPLRDLERLFSYYQTKQTTVTLSHDDGVHNTITISAGIPDTLEELFSDYKRFLIANRATVKDSFPQGFMKALADTYAATHGLKLDSFGGGIDTTVGDWSVFSSGLSSIPNLYVNSNLNPITKMVNAYLQSHTNEQLVGPEEDYPLPHFFAAIDNIFTATALIQKPSNAYLNTGVPADTFANIPSYQATFEMFGPPDPTGELFKAKIRQFAQQQINTKGYFDASESYEQFATEVFNSGTGGIIGSSSLDGNGSEKAQILDRILRILIKLISSLQNVGIAQAERLRFLTQYQQAYTTLQTKMPVFLRGDGTPLGRTGDDTTEVAQDRNDINSSFNANLIDNVRALRGIQEDNAKKLQTNINQTNDAVNQQTDMATSFIQTLSTLLSTILR